MELSVYTIEGKETGRAAYLADRVFDLENPNDHAIYQDVRLILANQRQGTHKAKERAEIAGSTKKLYRQKGTGNARVGSAKSPTRRHGGRIFGPRPRTYGFKLNKKVKALARKSVLTYKAKEGKIKVVENFEFEAPKTKQYLEILSSLELTGKKTLLITSEPNQNVYLSGRNLPKTQIIPVADLNTYDILNAEELILMEGAVEVINERLAK
ncbi:MAG: 50S ribosomal protein L4 [Bacteroidota bacterium]